MVYRPTARQSTTSNTGILIPVHVGLFRSTSSTGSIGSLGRGAFPCHPVARRSHLVWAHHHHRSFKSCMRFQCISYARIACASASCELRAASCELGAFALAPLSASSSSPSSLGDSLLPSYWRRRAATFSIQFLVQHWAAEAFFIILLRHCPYI